MKIFEIVSDIVINAGIANGFLLVFLMLPVKEPLRQGALTAEQNSQAQALPIGEVVAYLWQRKSVYGTHI